MLNLTLKSSDSSKKISKKLTCASFAVQGTEKHGKGEQQSP